MVLIPSFFFFFHGLRRLKALFGCCNTLFQSLRRCFIQIKESMCFAYFLCFYTSESTKKRPLLPYGESDLRLYSLCYSRGARILLPTSVCASCLNCWDKSHQYSKGLFWAVRSMYEPSRLYRI